MGVVVAGPAEHGVQDPGMTRGTLDHAFNVGNTIMVWRGSCGKERPRRHTQGEVPLLLCPGPEQYLAVRATIAEGIRGAAGNGVQGKNIFFTTPVSRAQLFKTPFD